MDRSSAYFLVSYARQWLVRRLLGRIAGRIGDRLTSSFLPLVSGLPGGSPDGSLLSLLPHSFRSSAYFLVPSARQ